MPAHDKPPNGKPPGHDKPPAGKAPARKRLMIDISEAHHLNPRLLAATGAGRRAGAAAAQKARHAACEQCAAPFQSGSSPTCRSQPTQRSYCSCPGRSLADARKGAKGLPPTELTLLQFKQAASSRGGPAPAYAPLPSLAPLRRAHSGSELMGLTADAAAAGQEHRDEHQSEGGNSGSSTPTRRRMKKCAFA